MSNKISWLSAGSVAGMFYSRPNKESSLNMFNDRSALFSGPAPRGTSGPIRVDVDVSVTDHGLPMVTAQCARIFLGPKSPDRVKVSLDCCFRFRVLKLFKISINARDNPPGGLARFG